MLAIYNNFNKYYSNNAPINLLEIGDEFCEQKYYVKRYSSPLYAFEYIIEGRNDYVIDGVSFSAVAGDIVYLPKKSHHTYGSAKGFNCHKKWFIFDGNFVKYLELHYLPENRYCFNIDGVSNIFDDILSLEAANVEEYNDILKKFSLKLYELFIKIFENKETKTHNNDSITDKMKLYIDENIMEKITIDDLANKFNYSKNHTIVLFRDRFGITPNQYFLNKKIEIACLYLRNTNCSVKSISEQLHFADQHYFTNVFTKKMSVSPTQYKRSLTISENEEHLKFQPKTNS